MKKKKKCLKGYSCGFSCISKFKGCRREFPEGISVTLDTMEVLRSPKKDLSIMSFLGLISELDSGKNVIAGVIASERRLNSAQALWSMWDGGIPYEVKKQVIKDSDKKADEIKADEIVDLVDYYAANVDKYPHKPTEEQERNLNKFREAGATLRGIEKAKEEGVKKVFELWDRVSDKEAQEFASEKIKERWGSSKSQAEKTKRFKAEGLTEMEATAMAAWISFEDYGDLNKSLYAPTEIEKATDLVVLRETNKLIAQATKKLPKANRKDMLSLWQSRKNGVEAEKLSYRKGSFRRGLKLPKNLVADLVSSYEASIGKEIREKTHFAATSRKELVFLRNANIVFDIKAKDDGKGNSVALDKYKNYNYEGEVFWPAGQKFKVLGVNRTKSGKATIRLEEVL